MHGFSVEYGNWKKGDNHVIHGHIHWSVVSHMSKIFHNNAW
ncbi:hypothetical protein DFP94_102239 [Fontibacillus phaseoli]|uniref:Uncharacterized protein n=1 Tax=Fontibacillus phaseoli TaxID=1416533 RepID=A0A369BLL5_9BACL|nr:hypothetical protein DFP94_102239 [Fontibacillus phaseoli]